MKLSIWSIGAVVVFLTGCHEAPDLITVTPAVVESPAEGQLTGAEILKRCERAYAALQSYEGTANVSSTTASTAWGTKTNSTKVKIWFSRPLKLRVEGNDTSGNPFAILCDGKEAWTAWKLEGSTFKHARNLNEAISQWQGVALGAPTMISSAIVPVAWDRDLLFLPRGHLLGALATKGKLSGQEDVDKHSCYKVLCEREIQTWTLWIDAETWLLRKVETTADAQQMAAQRNYGGGGTSGTIQKTSAVETYLIEKTNQKLDESLFQPK